VAALTLDPVVALVHSAALEFGTGLWLVGGVLRNLALRVSVAPDYDFVLAADDIEAFCASVAESIQGSAFLLDKETCSYRVAAHRGALAVTLDFSPVKGDILNDLKARDFTVNSLAVDLIGLFESGVGVVIDPAGGVADASEKVLRATSETVFDEDPLRSLRAVRLALQYGLSITPETLGLMKDKSGLLTATSVERRRDELEAIFCAKGSSWAMQLLYSTGIAQGVFPGAAGWADVNGYALLDHALKTLDAAEELLGELGVFFPEYGAALDAHFAEKRGTVDTRTVLKLAAFLHDYAKPDCLKREGGRLTFTGHDSAGAAMVRDALTGLKFSRSVASEVAFLVKNHHRVFNLALLKEPSIRAKAHFFRASGGAAGLTLLFLSLADARATRGASDPDLVRLAGEMIGFYYGVYLKKRPTPVLTGREVMDLFGVSEGPLVGLALKRVAEGVETGEITSKKAALALVKRFIEWQKGR